MSGNLIILALAVFMNLSPEITQIQHQEGVRGKIFFTDGTTKNFSRLKSLIGYVDGLRVGYENSTRVIPFDKLRSFEIVAYNWQELTEIQGAIAEYKIVDVSVRIQTTTGVTFETTFPDVGPLIVEIHDELTGGRIEQTYYLGTGGQPVKSKNRLLIGKILFRPGRSSDDDKPDSEDID